MKKLVTTLLLTAVTAVSIFAFTACGGNDDKEENKEPVYTVTAEGWNNAIETIVDGKSSIDCKWTLTTAEDGAMEFYLKYDLKNQAVNFSFTENEKTLSLYLWHGEGDKYYQTNNRSDGTISLDEIEKEDFDLGVESCIAEYCGGRGLTDLKTQFDKFTYDETKKEYMSNSAEGFFGDEGDVAYVIKCVDGKIVSWSATYDETTVYSYEYKYDVTVTVPDDVKNLK